MPTKKEQTAESKVKGTRAPKKNAVKVEVKAEQSPESPSSFGNEAMMVEELKPKKPGKRPSKVTVVPEPLAAETSSSSVATQLTHESISVRAYFISQQRHALGRPGDSASDWLQAEHQLHSERSTHN